MKKQQKKKVTKSKKSVEDKPIESKLNNRWEFKISIAFAGLALLANIGFIYAIQPVYEIIDNDNVTNISQTLDRSDRLSAIFMVVSIVSVAFAIFFLLIGLYNYVRSKSKAKS